jgi:hypothetical protein
MRHGYLLTLAIIAGVTAHAAPSPSAHWWVPAADTVGCRVAAIAAVNTWFRAVGTGDTLSVRRAMSPKFVWISAGRSDWPEPFFVARFVRIRAA